MAKKKRSFNRTTCKYEIGLYLRGEFLSALSKKDTIAIFQIIRIINSLEFWLRLLLKVKKEQSDVFGYRNRIEIYFAMICSYKESTKEFDNNLSNDLLKMNLPETIRCKISEYRNWLKVWKQDEYLRVVDRIRNCLRSHLKSCIYDQRIKDGNGSKDLMIGYATGNRVMDFIFTEPYSYEFAYIAEIVPESAGCDKLKWIQDKTLEEVNRFVHLLKELVCTLFKGNTYKKYIDA